MSTPQPSTSTPVAEDKSKKRRSFQRFVSKLIRSKPKKADPSETPAESSTAAAALTSTPGTVPEAGTSAPAETKAEETTAVEASAAKIPIGARQLAEKHGIEIPEDWPYGPRPPAGERVEKAIRMRVRRYCHVCQTSFGSEKSCSSCGHKRCAECPRSPAKTEKKKNKQKHKEFDPYEGLVIPAKHETQDRVYRKIRQRVHWKCHKCESDFAGQKVCPSCTHTRCKKCHREPNRKPKPYEDEAKPKKPVKWTCSECETPANITKNCSNCSHTRCVECVRERSKKKKPVLASDVASDTDTQGEGGQSLIDKVSSALAATSIAS